MPGQLSKYTQSKLCGRMKTPKQWTYLGGEGLHRHERAREPRRALRVAVAGLDRPDRQGASRRIMSAAAKAERLPQGAGLDGVAQRCPRAMDGDTAVLAWRDACVAPSCDPSRDGGWAFHTPLNLAPNVMRRKHVLTSGMIDASLSTKYANPVEHLMKQSLVKPSIPCWRPNKKKYSSVSTCSS